MRLLIPQQGAKGVAPQIVDVAAKLSQSLRPKGVDALQPVLAEINEIRALQGLKVLRDGGPADAGTTCQLPHGDRLVTQRLDNGAPRRVGKKGQCGWGFGHDDSSPDKPAVSINIC
jgi:hypothetical protein